MQEMDLEELNAFFRRRDGQKGARPDKPKAPGGAPRPQGERREFPPRDGQDARCSNCGVKGHTGRECTKPRKEMSDRECFLCGKCGHQARQCPNKTAQAKALTDTTPATVLSLGTAEPRQRPASTTFIGCLGCADFVPIHRGRNVTPVARAAAMAPRPRGCLMGELLENAFECLDSSSDDEKKATTTTTTTPSNLLENSSVNKNKAKISRSLGFSAVFR